MGSPEPLSTAEVSSSPTAGEGNTSHFASHWVDPKVARTAVSGAEVAAMGAITSAEWPWAEPTKGCMACHCAPADTTTGAPLASVAST